MKAHRSRTIRTMATKIKPGDIVGPAKRGVQYWEAEVVAVNDDLLILTYGHTEAGPIEWPIPAKEVFLVFRNQWKRAETYFFG